jgi:hypothetical protein
VRVFVVPPWDEYWRVSRQSHGPKDLLEFGPLLALDRRDGGHHEGPDSHLLWHSWRPRLTECQAPGPVAPRRFRQGAKTH